MVNRLRKHPNKVDDTAIVVMAGGQSTRFGTNKALALWKGTPLVENAIQKALAVTDKVALSVRDEADYPWLNVKKIPDFIKGIGPMGGLYSALKTLDEQNVVLVACDMPFLDADLMNFLIKYECNEPVLIPKAGGRLHPLHARYHKSVLPIIEELIERGSYKMAGLLERVPVKVIDQSEVGERICLARCLSNVNTPEDFKRILNETDSGS